MATVELKADNFDEEVLKATLPVMIDFWAPWCGPCRAVEPIIEELAQDYKGKLIVYRFNVDENSSIASRFGIRAIPTLLFLKSGEVYDQIIGAVPKSAVEEVVKKILTA
jgi:thioredoxin 1